MFYESGLWMLNGEQITRSKKVSRLSEKRQWIMVVYIRKSDGSGSGVKCNNPLNVIELETEVQREQGN